MPECFLFFRKVFHACNASIASDYVKDRLAVIYLQRSFSSLWFRLDGELLYCQQRQKSNQKNAAPISLPFGFPRHSTLPTGRPESPSGLHWTKSDIHVGFTLPKPNTSANFKGDQGEHNEATPIGNDADRETKLNASLCERNEAISFSILNVPKSLLRFARNDVE
jgi:hypothetical protein